MGFSKAKSFINRTFTTKSVSIKMFFDNPAIERYVSNVERKYLENYAKRLMRSARGNLKKTAKNKPAPAGQPFHVHGKSASGLKRSILYAYDTKDNTAVIGASHAFDVFRKHEYGGRFPVINRRRKKKQIGDLGAIAWNRYKEGKKRKNFRRDVKNPFYAGTRKRTDKVEFARITTEKQLERVNTIEEQLYGPHSGIADYEPRPLLETTLKDFTAMDASLEDLVSNIYM